MTKLFYDHLIIIEEVVALFEQHGIGTAERRQLLSLIDTTMHQEILTTILTLLPRKHHEEFLIRFHAAPHDASLLVYLKDRSVVDVEKEILKAANNVKKTLIKEIEAAKRG
jgi:hypothetical protein